MIKIVKITFLLAIVIFGVAGFLLFASKKPNSQIVLISPLARTVSAQTVSPASTFGQLVNDTTESLPTPIPTTITKKMDRPVNILLLGLDGRRGDKNPRCDTIHMLSFNPAEGKILITTVPRGTLVELSAVERESRYLGNSCHLAGIDFAVSAIEKLTGIHPDHIVKVEFSQTLGILRLLNFPTTPTLQFLRNRHYPRGDYQRGRNQALFIKDMMVSHFEQFTQLPKPIQYLAFKMVETDIDFEKAIFLLNQILESGVTKDSSRIEIVTKPQLFFPLKELHFSEEEFLDESAWQNDSEFKNYQNNLEDYFANLISRAEGLYQASKNSQAFQLIATPFNQQLWLQLEDEDKRHHLHFDLLRLFVITSPEKSNLTSLLLDFITEMETVNQTELKVKAEKLLEIISL